MTVHRQHEAETRPAPGDWVAYTADRERPLAFAPDLAVLRQRLADDGIKLADCFLSRLPMKQDDLMLGAAEIDIV